MNDWISDLLAVQRQVRREASFDDPIQRLLQEHRIIADITCTLEVWSIRAEQGDEVDQECASALVSLLLEFVDEVHHEKEESILVPRLVQLGLMQHPDHLRTDHQHEHYLVTELSRLTTSSEPPRYLRGGRFATLARELAAFQRAHLESETRELYGLLERLDVEPREALKRELRAFDRRKEPVLRSWRTRLRWLTDRRSASAEHDATIDDITAEHDVAAEPSHPPSVWA